MKEIENQPNQMNAGGSNPFNPFMPGMPSSGAQTSGMNPFANPNPFGGANMMNPFGMPKNTTNPFAANMPNMSGSPNGLTDEEIDRMIADIDKKLKELDEVEAASKTPELPKSVPQIDLPKQVIEEKTPFAFMNEEPEVVPKDLKPQEPVLPKLDSKPEEKMVIQEDKPKINIDADSIIMNDNIITDDEFFDDFFGED